MKHVVMLLSKSSKQGGIDEKTFDYPVDAFNEWISQCTEHLYGSGGIDFDIVLMNLIHGGSYSKWHNGVRIDCSAYIVDGDKCMKLHTKDLTGAETTIQFIHKQGKDT